MMLLPEPLRELDLMKLTKLVSSHQHQSTVVKEQWSVALYRPSPGPSRFRANGSHQPFPADRTDSAFFQVEFGTLRPFFSEGYVAAAEMQGVKPLFAHTFIWKTKR